jgi:hypothetical protein
MFVLGAMHAVKNSKNAGMETQTRIYRHRIFVKNTAVLEDGQTTIWGRLVMKATGLLLF